MLFDPAKKDSREFVFPGGTALLSLSEPVLNISLPYKAAYGMGEKFDRLNQKGFVVVNKVEEQFCGQENHTYCPTPFFFTDSGFGLFTDTLRVTAFMFLDGMIQVFFTADAEKAIDCGPPGKAPWPPETRIMLFSGPPESIIREYMALSGEARLPPEWVFGIWISANRWNSQKQIEEQLSYLDKYRFPASVLVIEAWSDEASFYIWNGASYTPVDGGASLAEADFDFSKSAFWPDPKGMIQNLHKRNIRLVLWQIPVHKPQERHDPPCPQRDNDRAFAIKHRHVAYTAGDEPYTIPPGHWFAGSLLPDFTSEEARKLWFAKRQYLLDMGVDGFKTDGGEFVYQQDLVFAGGQTGAEMINGYAQAYTGAYADFAGPGRALFSRAGYTGQHTAPVLWAGDQKSTFAELRACLRAGLSAALSGAIFWGFDIGGFAGPLPTPELYMRATELACFCPIMQWHSEPEGGQFAGTAVIHNNERSPWNIAAAWFGEDSAEAEAYLAKLRFCHEQRLRLIPYLYREAAFCVREYAPLMRPLVYEYPHEEACFDMDDEYLLGNDLLAAPVLYPCCASRKVWFPEGSWRGLFDGKTYHGGWSEVSAEKIPVFVKEGRSLP